MLICIISFNFLLFFHFVMFLFYFIFYQSESRVKQERERWMVSIGECLLFVLDQSSPTPESPMSQTGTGTGGTNTPGGGISQDPQSSSPVTHLAPVLAGMFLEIALSFGANTEESFQCLHWIFWELAKVLPLDMILYDLL